jgi:hypothetical protein
LSFIGFSGHLARGRYLKYFVMDGGDDEAKVFLGCVAEFAAVEIEMRQESQVPWTMVPVRSGGRRFRSPSTGVGSPAVTQAAKRVCQDNPYRVLTPQEAASEVDVGESVQVISPPRVTRSSVRRQEEADRLAAARCEWDKVLGGVMSSQALSESEERGGSSRAEVVMT